jgi:hypothetical protein
MSGWDILNELMKSVPPVAALLFFLALGVIFAVGFSKHGVNFIKYGFNQTILGDSLDKRFDAIDKRLEAIETNHFGHLKNFLTELTSILVDKGVIDNQSKARLDNQLRGM